MGTSTFFFPWHIPRDEYPTQKSIAFGGGYSSAVKPKGPDQILVNLKFATMFFFDNGDAARTINRTANPTLNILALQDFYESVRMWDTFFYYHVTRGTVKVRFSKALIMPEPDVSTPGAVGGLNGYRAHRTTPFDMQLMIQP